MAQTDLYITAAAAILSKDPTRKTKTPAWRIQVPDRAIGFSDGINWTLRTKIRHTISAILSCFSADGYWAYQLSVVADDADQGITHIVRGQDLLVSTPRQIYLQQCPRRSHTGLRLPSPIP